jgi:phospholipid/cholesterol/gamma-HCH transport system substrate-binding protein
METRANYVLIGAFTLAAVIGAFLFIMWIAGYGAAGGHRSYQVVFTGSVAGLSTGANVSFNGIKVGEVTHLTFSRSDPHQVVADIDVNSEAPIDRNTRARLETQGLTGGAVVALLGGTTAGAELVGQNGRPPIIYAGQSVQLQDILDNVSALSIKATSILDDADKLITDNSEPIRSAIANVDQFSKALADNSAGVDAALKSVGELGKQIGPLAARLQTLSDDADRLVQSIDINEVRTIVDNVQSMSAKGVSIVDRADKLLADNADSIHSTLQNADAFAKTLADNAPNVDVTLKNLAEISKTVQPVVAQIQSLSQNADRVLKAVDPDKVRTIVDNVQSLSGKSNSVVDRADKLLADNSATIHSTLQNTDVFAKALADNAPNVDITLKNLAELSKTVQPVVAQIQDLSQSADRVVKAVDPDKVRTIVDNVQSLSGKSNSVVDRADKLLGDNSATIHSTLQNADVFAKALADNAPNVDVTLKNLAELSKTVQPVVAQIQGLSQSADRVVKAVDPDKVHALVNNAQTFSQALAESSQNFETLARNGAQLATHLNEDTSKRLDTALNDVNDLAKAIDSQKIAGIVNSANEVVQTVHQNRGNIDATLKNFSEMSAKLNESADKVDGVLTSAQSFLGSPGTKGAVDRISEAALSVKKLADDVDSRIKDIATGLSRFTNSGLREYEALAIEGRRTVEDIDRVVRSIGQNPSQVIFGSRPSLPEYHGGQ